MSENYGDYIFQTNLDLRKIFFCLFVLFPGASNNLECQNIAISRSFT